MKNCFTAVIAGVCIIIAAVKGRAASWSVENYQTFTGADFERYKPALQRIDMENIDYPLLHAAVFYETNRQRERHGLAAFKHSPALERSAWGHSRDMVRYGFFSHTSPVKGKITLSMRLEAQGIVNAAAAENVAYTFGIEYVSGKPVYSPEQNGGYFSYRLKGDPIENHTYLGLAKAVVRGWMKSPPHRKNILNARYTFLGVGAAHYRNSSFYNMDNFKLTQNFSNVRGGDE